MAGKENVYFPVSREILAGTVIILNSSCNSQVPEELKFCVAACTVVSCLLIILLKQSSLLCAHTVCPDKMFLKENFLWLGN